MHTSGSPGAQTRGTSAGMRAEFDLIQAGFDLVAPSNSPAFTGTPTAPTPVAGDNSTKLATTAFVTALAFSGVLPGQAGNAGKALITDGTNASWSTVTWSIIASTPTTLAGYGITDAVKSTGGTATNLTLAGTTAAPTPLVDNSSTSIATTAWVMGQGSSSAPTMNAVAASGTSTRWARDDHVHPVDTSRAPINSPTFTGTVGGITKSMVGLANVDNTADSAKSVNYAASAGTTSNLSGITGWAYSGLGGTPSWVWSTNGSASSQFLTNPANFSVNYANNAGTAGYCSGNTAGTAGNSNALGGSGPGYFVNNASSAVVNLRNNATIQMLCGVSGVGDMFWGASTSDARLKTDIAPTQVDSLAEIAQIRFVSFKFREDLDFQVDPIPGREWHVGLIAQEAELINDNWICNAGTWKQPDLYPMLMSAMHGIQQQSKLIDALTARVAALEAR